MIAMVEYDDGGDDDGDLGYDDGIDKEVTGHEVTELMEMRI